MAKEKKVEQITDMEVDFAQWYTDICMPRQMPSTGLPERTAYSMT